MSLLAERPPEVSEAVSLSDLLKLLLCIPSHTPVYGTPSFASWLNAGKQLSWPPPANARGGLLLIDTRDRAARTKPVMLAIANGAAPPAFDAALILTGSGRPGGAIKRALRRLRYPGTRRLPEERVATGLQAGGFFVDRLSFKDDLDVPADFELVENPHLTGAAFLVMNTPSFSGALWSKTAGWLNSGVVTLESFQLRARGAAVIMLRANERRFVVRAVPPGPLQPVVSRNYHALLELRASLRDSTLRDFIPAPVFAERDGDTLVLGETLLDGNLAWRVAMRGLAGAVHASALGFLEELRAATRETRTLTHDDIRQLFAPDESLLLNSSFVSPVVRDLLEREFQEARSVLEGAALHLYASHGDFGYGNILVDERDGRLTGVIDWDTARRQDFSGIDRVNLEIQTRRSRYRESFARAVETVWRERIAHEALRSEGGESHARTLFGLAVCRYITRSFNYPAVYARESAGFERALQWLSRTGRQA